MIKFVLVNSNYSPLFPCLNYCGGDRWMESLAWAFYKRNIPFYVISPKRKIKNEVPFEVVETESPPENEVGLTNYINEVYQILKDRNDFQFILSNSNWSAVLSKLKPSIVTLHDGLEKCEPNWLEDFPDVKYRFVSESQYIRLCPANLKDKSFWLYLGLPEEEFQYYEHKKGYYLFVSSLHWDAQAKGIDIFLKLAQDNPQKEFTLYGIGNKQLEEFLISFSKKHENFSFCGELKNEDRNKVFGEARAFCQLSRLKESMGTSVVSALAKGTAVIGLDSSGATKELISNYFPSQKSYERLENLLYCDYDSLEVLNYSKKFNINIEVDVLLGKCEEILSRK